jgi:lipopolysaccharide export system protein LptA
MIVVFVGLTTAYEVYGHFLGGIDGLTPLPEHYWPQQEVVDPPKISPHVNKAEEKLIQAFHKDCEELKRINRLEVPSRHLVLAVDKFEPVTEGEHKGEILLQPFSVAMFGKGTGDHQEINTIKSRYAYLTFDRPINSISEIGKAKIVAAELVGNVQISNNRGTPDRTDDLYMSTEGPVYYDEPKHLIFTKKPVRLEDSQEKPQPMIITAVGMDVELTPPDAAPAAVSAANSSSEKKSRPKASARPGQPETISGVDRITLRSQVQMDLYLDPRSGFMSAESSPKGPAAAAVTAASKGSVSAGAAPDKDHVQITTQGPFVYDVTKDFGVFEMVHKLSNLPSRVHVTRQHLEPGAKDEKKDELFCDRLELQFHRKEAPVNSVRATEPPDRSVELDIDWAHALQLQDDPVSVISYAEVLNASCHDLYYDARTKQTTLQGKPEVVALKEGNMIRAAELHLTAADQQKPQQVTAKGPGQIDMLDREKAQQTSHASWRDWLTSTKDGTYDCLILTGDAAFFQDERPGEQHGKIQGDQIKVWFEPAKPSSAPPNQKTGNDKAPQPDPSAPADQQRLKPHHLEATGHARVFSPELNLKEAEHLLIWFKDVAETDLPPVNPGLADRAGPKNAGDATTVGSIGDINKGTGQNPSARLTANPVASKGKDISSPPVAPRPGSSLAPAPGGQTSGSAPKKPLNVQAREVKAHVIRTDHKNDLESLFCEGKVRVKQEPATPEDKGVDIRGDSLQLNHFIDGNILLVTGNARELAWVQLDKLTMQGKEVNIDQRANRSWINDIGVMQMLTATDFEGNKLAHPTQVTIHWNKEMHFDGKQAFFSGGVTAEQNNSRLRCQEMQVTLDRPVSFKEGEKNSASAKVEHLVCDHGQSKQVVMVEDTKFEGSKLVGYQRLHSQELYVDNKEGKMEASGPNGIFNLLQLGTAEEGAPGSPEIKKTSRSPAAPKAKEELKLTRVYFSGRLNADNKKRLATFYDDVKVHHLPADDPDIQVDEAHPPAGCMILRCKMLKVFSESLPNGQKNQKMQATGQVYIQGRSRSPDSTRGAGNSGNDTPDYWGDAQVLKFDESSDWIILDGGDGDAHLYRVLAPGARPDKVEAKKIWYNRKDRTYRLNEGAGISITLPPPSNPMRK